MEVEEDQIDFKDGIFEARNTNKKMAFGEVALQAYVAHKFDSDKIEPGLKEGAFYDPKNFNVSLGRPHCRSRNRSRYRRDYSRTLDRSR